jgi:CP family cyanate transporter-like MFS transporter
MADHATAARAVGSIGDRMPLVIGLLLTSLTLRPQVVGVGPLVPEIQQALGMSHAFTGLLVTIPVLCLGIFAPLAPIIAGRIGAINAVSAAGLLIAAAGMARALVPGATGLLIFTFLLGIGMGVGNALMVIAVKERFADRPLLLTAVYSTGIQVGATASAVLAVPLSFWLDGWRGSLFAMSAASLVFVLAWIVVTRKMHTARQRGVFPRFPLRSSIVWSFAAMFGLMGIVFYGLATWAPAAYLDLAGGGADRRARDTASGPRRGKRGDDDRDAAVRVRAGVRLRLDAAGRHRQRDDVHGDDEPAARRRG